MKKSIKNSLSSNESLKQFLLSLIATTVSIILTFGTSAVIEHHHKEKDKREMVMMIIYDFDKTIEQVQYADSVFYESYKAQLEVALHPESFDSLRSCFISTVMIPYIEFAETTEKIFSTNIETFNTIGNVGFVQEVSAFYNARRFYQETVLDEFKKEVIGSAITMSIEGLFSVDIPMYYVYNKQSLMEMQKICNRCMRMMKVSKEELKEFSYQHSVLEDNSEDDDEVYDQGVQEYLEAERIIRQAKMKLEQEK
jgi:hypothetical protein